MNASINKTLLSQLLAYKDSQKWEQKAKLSLQKLHLLMEFKFYEHQYISKKLECDFYFVHPYCSWERGLSENTNGLVRQYIPKGTYFEKVSKETIKEIQHKINRRPRLTLNFEEPTSLFYKFVT